VQAAVDVSEIRKWIEEVQREEVQHEEVQR
jgi:hypothetical protein